MGERPIPTKAEYVRKNTIYKRIYELRYKSPSTDYEVGCNDALDALRSTIEDARPITMRRSIESLWVWDDKESAWRCARCGTINENLHRMKGVDVTIWPGGKFCPECGSSIKSNQIIAFFKQNTEERYMQKDKEKRGRKE